MVVLCELICPLELNADWVHEKYEKYEMMSIGWAVVGV